MVLPSKGYSIVRHHARLCDCMRAYLTLSGNRFGALPMLADIIWGHNLGHDGGMQYDARGGEF